MKTKKYFVCNECGFESDKWFAKCPSCNSISSAVEFTADIDFKKNKKTSKITSEITYLDEEVSIPVRIKTSIKEFNDSINGGFVKGGIYLISGEPGIGKSTLISQISKDIDGFVLYATGEESKTQVIQRYKRLNIENKNIGLIFENDIDSIINTISKSTKKPSVVFIDSIQTMKSDEFDSIAGSILQVRECSKKITNFAKNNDITIVLIGHVNKEGAVAGPKILEHIVDCVIQFDLEKTSGLRMVRITKNRYGPTDEIILLEMTSKGLIPIENMNEFFLNDYSNESGNTLTIIKEGNKLIPIEIQALVSKPVYGTPRRITSGVPLDRVLMISAVLSKKLKMPIESKDIFVSTSGGFKINDSAIDLAIANSLVSSLLETPPLGPTIAIGEIGLDGKIRSVSSIEKRIEISKRLGMENILIPEKNSKKVKSCTPIKNINELVKLFKGV